MPRSVLGREREQLWKCDFGKGLGGKRENGGRGCLGGVWLIHHSVDFLPSLLNAQVSTPPTQHYTERVWWCMPVISALRR